MQVRRQKTQDAMQVPKGMVKIVTYRPIETSFPTHYNQDMRSLPFPWTLRPLLNNRQLIQTSICQ